jgi:hypothetical protein
MGFCYPGGREAVFYSVEPIDGGIQQLVAHLISIDTLQELETKSLRPRAAWEARLMPDGDGVAYIEEDHGVRQCWFNHWARPKGN